MKKLLRRSGSFNREIVDEAKQSGEFSLVKIPVSPSLIESLRPGTLYATTGVPIAFVLLRLNPILHAWKVSRPSAR
jgi:hypothetical protein